jgi:hypothetical protein
MTGMELACACGAVGRVLPPDFGYERDVRAPLVHWSGGVVGAGWAAIEERVERTSSCPACGRRRCAYVALGPAAAR